MKPFRLLVATTCLACHVSADVSPHPSIEFREFEPFSGTHIEIATDEHFEKVVDQDFIENLNRYVTTVSLKPGTYHWRAVDGQDRQQRFSGSFEVEEPKTTVSVPLGSGLGAIDEALTKAAANDSTVIRFESGTYHLHPERDDTIFEIAKTEHLIIDGQGSKFVIHGIATLARITDSRDISLQNFTVDYEPTPYTAAKVESIDANGEMVLSLWPGARPPEEVDDFMKEKRGLFYDPEYPRMAEDVPILLYMEKPWEPLGNGRYRLILERKESADSIEPGMVYICAPRYRSQGIEIYSSDNVTLANLTSYYLPGIGVLTNFSDDLKMIGVNMLRREDRLLGVQNGGTNIHGARKGPWVENCRFENTGDDNNHISSLLHPPIEQPAPNEVVISHQQFGVRFHHSDMRIRPGDRIAFFDRTKARLIDEATVVEVTAVTKTSTKLTLDRELPPLELSKPGTNLFREQYTQIYNLDRSCNFFAFRNNEFLRGRRTGILAKSGPGLIENNRIEELGGGGVEIFNGPLEGLHGHDILIQNNAFRRGGVAARNRKPAPAIWVDLFIWDVDADPLHRDIRILNNTIENYKGHAMELNDITGLVVVDNTIEINEPDLDRRTDLEPIFTENVLLETITGNSVDGQR